MDDLITAAGILVITSTVSALHLKRASRHHEGIGSQERSATSQQHGAGESHFFSLR